MFPQFSCLPSHCIKVTHRARKKPWRFKPSQAESNRVKPFRFYLWGPSVEGCCGCRPKGWDALHWPSTCCDSRGAFKASSIEESKTIEALKHDGSILFAEESFQYFWTPFTMGLNGVRRVRSLFFQSDSLSQFFQIGNAVRFTGMAFHAHIAGQSGRVYWCSGAWNMHVEQSFHGKGHRESRQKDERCNQALRLVTRLLIGPVSLSTQLLVLVVRARQNGAQIASIPETCLPALHRLRHLGVLS